MTGSHGLPNPFEGPADSTTSLSLSRNQMKVAIRTEAEQQAAAKARERQEVSDHRDARRKSLGKSKKSMLYSKDLPTVDTFTCKVANT